MAALVSASAADDPTTAEKVQTPRPLAGEVTAVEAHVENGVSVSARTPTLFPISRELVFDNYVVFPDGTTVHQFRPPTLTASERVIYSDTLGKVVLPMPVNQLIADDITTTTPDGCNLTRFTFQTTGRANPNQDGGAYSVSYALYSFCPRSVAQANRPSLIIPGTSGTVAFPDDGFHILTVLLPPNTSIPTNFYLGISANRSNVGIIMGAPPLIGLSCDVIDHPVLACGATLGGFPDQPYASFNAEFFADDDTCPTSFVAYRNDNPKQSAFLTGANHPIYDDLHLNTNNCLMTSYEVMVKGSGYYSFELSTSCGGAAIPGTHVEQPVTATPGVPNKLAFKLDPPVHVPQDLWLSAMVNNSTAGIIMTGRDACTGHTADFLCDPSGLVLLSPPDNLQEAFDITITCVGSPPVGACCDMFVLDDNGEAVCRQVPQMNCPFPPVGDNIARPKWVPGAACDPSPFAQPCGVSACCAVYEKPDPSNPNQTRFVEECQNRTQNQCKAQHPITPQYPDGAPSLWERGLYCAQQGQICPRVACLRRGEDCTTPQTTVGCNDAFCCNCVCQSFGSVGSYCCDVEWDEICVELIYAPPCGGPSGSCGRLQPSWDVCSSIHPGVGAHLINVPGTFSANMTNITGDESDPQFCCHNGFQPKCIGGPLDGFNCETSDDCCEFECGTCTFFHCAGGPNDQGACSSNGDCCSNVCGICPARNPGPNNGDGSGWLKFVVPVNQTSVSISTCRSSGPASDSLIQVFDCSDHTSEQSCCGSLIPIGCNDDTPGCGYTGNNSSLCLKGLVPGRIYYVMLAAKTDATRATYIVDVTSPCRTQGRVPRKEVPRSHTRGIP